MLQTSREDTKKNLLLSNPMRKYKPPVLSIAACIGHGYIFEYDGASRTLPLIRCAANLLFIPECPNRI